MVLVKSWQLFHFFIVGKIRQENEFQDILERKRAVLDYKKVKKVEKLAFLKVVSPRFW